MLCSSHKRIKGYTRILFVCSDYRHCKEGWVKNETGSRHVVFLRSLAPQLVSPPQLLSRPQKTLLALDRKSPSASWEWPHISLRPSLRGGLRLAWDTQETIRSFNQDWQPASGGPQIGLAFLVDSPADVDATYERLVSLGYDGHKEPFDAPWGQRYALVHDPDGNSVDLFASL